MGTLALQQLRHALWAFWQALRGEQMMRVRDVPAPPPMIMLPDPVIVTQYEKVWLAEPDPFRFKVDVYTKDGACRTDYIGNEGARARDAWLEAKHTAHLHFTVMYDRGVARCRWPV